MVLTKMKASFSLCLVVLLFGRSPERAGRSGACRQTAATPRQAGVVSMAIAGLVWPVAYRSLCETC